MVGTSKMFVERIHDHKFCMLGLCGSLMGLLTWEQLPDCQLNWGSFGRGEQPPPVNILRRKAPWETC